jgi:hypothetical protein
MPWCLGGDRLLTGTGDREIIAVADRSFYQRFSWQPLALPRSSPTRFSERALSVIRSLVIALGDSTLTTGFHSRFTALSLVGPLLQNRDSDSVRCARAVRARIKSLNRKGFSASKKRVFGMVSQSGPGRGLPSSSGPEDTHPDIIGTGTGVGRTGISYRWFAGVRSTVSDRPVGCLTRYMIAVARRVFCEHAKVNNYPRPTEIENEMRAALLILAS